MPSADDTNATRTPGGGQASPTKSSMSPSKLKSSFDHETGNCTCSSSMDEHNLVNVCSLHLHAKSEAFDAATPQINEYEMATPYLSSAGTNSREGSYKSFGYECEDDGALYDPANIDHHEDSFDVSLEDTGKTPVIGRDDWRAAMSATTDAMLGSPRSLPSPPAALASKSDTQNISNGKMALEEKLRLIILTNDNGAKTAAEQQRERRRRRDNDRERFGSLISEPEFTTSMLEEQESDDTIGDISLHGDYEVPSRISREVSMRRVNGNKAVEHESDYNFSSPAPISSPQRNLTRSTERQLPLDPDVPITMLDGIDKNDGGRVIITRNPEGESDEDSVFHPYQHFDAEPQDNESFRDDDVDTQSHYSQTNEFKAHVVTAQEAEIKEAETKVTETEEVVTLRARTPLAPTQPLNLSKFTPDLAPSTGRSAFSQNLESYMIPELESEPEKAEEPVSHQPKRSQTPEQRISKPEYHETGWDEPEDEGGDEPGTFDSAICHPLADNDEGVFEDGPPKGGPVKPERTATVKASGSELKTRISKTSTDLQAMREVRRQVSYEVSDVLPILAKHRKQLSKQTENAEDDDCFKRHPSFKNRSLTLDLDLGLSLGYDFERIIGTQKVALNLPLHSFLQGVQTSIWQENQ